MKMASVLLIGVALAGCGAFDSRTLELKGPKKVVVRALGQVDAPPTAMLSDGSKLQGAVVKTDPEGVVEVTAEGVFARAPGEASVSTEWNGQQVSWTLVVSPPLQLSLVNVPGQLGVGETAAAGLTASVAGVTAEPKGAVWTSSNPEILMVSSSGELRGVAPGVSFVMVKVADSEAMVEVSVRPTE
ncbi:MAG: hypothetical protein ACI9MC_002888 [Kiritimatiellia bacterium]|jgi:hypothetical protein